MSWSKIFALATVVLFVFGMAIIDDEATAEKVKWHGTSD